MRIDIDVGEKIVSIDVSTDTVWYMREAGISITRTFLPDHIMDELSGQEKLLYMLKLQREVFRKLSI